MNPFFNIDKKILSASDRAIKKCRSQFEKIEEVAEYNQFKVQSAFIEFGISESHFVSSTGYGYDDRGRDTLDKNIRSGGCTCAP